MSKRSGFQVTVRAFIAADAFDLSALRRANIVLEGLPKALDSWGFVNIEVEAKPRHRVEVPEAPSEPPAAESERTALSSNSEVKIEPEELVMPTGGYALPGMAPMHEAMTDGRDALDLPPMLDRRGRA